MVDNNPNNQDVAVSRLLDGRGRAADWRALREFVQADPAVWDRVIGSAGDQDALGDLLTDAAGNCDQVLREIDAACAGMEPQSLLAHAAGRRPDRAARAARLGWLVAACLAVGLVSVWVKTPAAPMGGQGAGVVSLDSMPSSALMDKYKARATTEGLLVAELPQRTVLESRPTADGRGREVLYLRQFIERAVVDNVYKLGTDDAGRPVMVPTRMHSERPAGAM